MIKTMRDFAPTIMWIVIVAFIGTIFFAWGMDFTSRKQEPYVGKVKGETIYLRNFDRQVAMERENMRRQMGGEIPPQQNRMIPRQVFEAQVSRTLHREVFERMQLGASADEIFTHLKNNPPPEIVQSPYFQTDSVFDTSKFVQFLNTPESYDNQAMQMLEAHTRDMLIPMNKLKTLTEAVKYPTHAEMAREYRAQNEKAVFEFVKVSPFSFSVDSSEISDGDIKQYYTTNRDSFIEESQAELYYVNIPKEPTQSDEQVYRSEILDMKKRIESGESTFEEEAQIESDDEGSAEKGGDLGWFGRGQMVPAFEKAAFSMEPGAISGPVKSRFGFHLIKVEDRKMEGDSVAQIKARHILRKIRPTMETIDSLEQIAIELQDSIDAKGFHTAVAAYPGIQADSTGLFKKGDFIPGLGYVSGAASFAFTHEVGETSDRIEDEKAFYIVHLKRRTDEGLLPLEEVRQQIINALIAQRQREKAKAHLEQTVKGLENNASLAHVQETDSLLSSDVSDTVSRKDYVPAVGYNNEVHAAAFNVPLNSLSPIVETKDAYFVVRPVWRKEIENISEWDSPEMITIRQTLVSNAKQKAYYDWYMQVKDQAKVVDNLDEYYID